MATRAEIQTHRLINRERKKRGIPAIIWHDAMYNFAKVHADKMAMSGRLFHSGRVALEGGENVSGGRGCRHRPNDFLKSWLKSRPHREWILDYRVKYAAVGITSSTKGTFAAWSFCESSPLTLHHGPKIKILSGSGERLLTKILSKLWHFGDNFG